MAEKSLKFESVGVNILLARECSVSGHTYALQSVIKKPRQHTWEWLHINVRYVGIIKDLIQKLKKVSLNKGVCI